MSAALVALSLLLLPVEAAGERGHDPSSVFTVALDPGHGGTNLGAAGVRPGVFEKAVTLEIARKAAGFMGRNRRLRVVLCRDSDELVPIRARVRCANEAGADLFLSLHANASPLGKGRGTQRGFELYVLTVSDGDRVAALAAAGADNPAEAAWQASRTHTLIEAGLEAAKRMQWELADALGKDRDRGVKQKGASLDVLHGLEMPGVLLEVGFLDHNEEGLELISKRWQERIAQALSRAVSDLGARARRAATDPTITAERKPSPR